MSLCQDAGWRRKAVLMAACGSLGLNYLPLDGYFSDNNKQSMINSECGIVVVYLTTTDQTLPI